MACADEDMTVNDLRAIITKHKPAGVYTDLTTGSKTKPVRRFVDRNLV